MSHLLILAMKGSMIHKEWYPRLKQYATAKTIYSAANQRGGVYPSDGRQRYGLCRANLKPFRVVVNDVSLSCPWLIGSISELSVPLWLVKALGDLGNCCWLKYTRFKLGGGAACPWEVDFPGIDLFWAFPVLENRKLGLVSQTTSLQPVLESAWLC